MRDEFKRNIGLVTEAEQDRLSRTHVAIAGAGGVGGIHALTLARLGVGGFTLADPDLFEAVNVNRQYGAFLSTFGRNKAEVIAEQLRDINPAAEVRTLPCRLDAGNADAFLDGADILVDGIDFFEIEARRLLFQRAAARGLYALTAAPLGFGATLQVFAPRGMSFDAYYGIEDGMDPVRKLAAFAVGLAPKPYHLRYLDLSNVSLTQRIAPALALACTLAASLVACEVVKIVAGKGEVCVAPNYLQIDLLRRRLKYGRVVFGGKNPLQRLKRWYLVRKAGKAGVKEPESTHHRQ